MKIDLTKKDNLIYKEFINRFNLNVLDTFINEELSYLFFEQPNKDKKEVITAIGFFFDTKDFELLTITSKYYLLVFEF